MLHYMRMKKLYDRIQELEEQTDNYICKIKALERRNKQLEYKLQNVEEYIQQYEEKGHHI